MQKATGRTKVMVKCDIPAEHLKMLKAIRDTTGIEVTELFTAMLERIGDGFRAEDVPMGEKRILRLYLDRGLLSRLRRIARSHGAGTCAFVRAVIARELARISKLHKS